VVDIKPYKATFKKQLDDDLTSSFGNHFKFPKIEGIDDVEEKPAPKSEVTVLGNALLGKGQKDYNDQAEDLLAETFDQDVQAAEDKKRRIAEQQKID
jgi:hypothetical protein